MRVQAFTHAGRGHQHQPVRTGSWCRAATSVFQAEQRGGDHAAQRRGAGGRHRSAHRRASPSSAGWLAPTRHSPCDGRNPSLFSRSSSRPWRAAASTSLQPVFRGQISFSSGAHVRVVAHASGSSGSRGPAAKGAAPFITRLRARAAISRARPRARASDLHAMERRASPACLPRCDRSKPRKESDNAPPWPTQIPYRRMAEPGRSQGHALGCRGSQRALALPQRRHGLAHRVRSGARTDVRRGIAAGLLYLKLLGDHGEASGAAGLRALVTVAITVVQGAQRSARFRSAARSQRPRALVIPRRAAALRRPRSGARDLLVLREGDRVAADATLIEATTCRPTNRRSAANRRRGP